METKHGIVEIIQHVNNNELLVRFVETGGIVLTTMRKLDNGTVTDPLAKVRKKVSKPRWEVTLADGSTFVAAELSSVSERTGVHEATVRKIAQGSRTHKAIASINRI